MDLMGMFCQCRAVERFVLPDSRVRTISVTTKILFFMICRSHLYCPSRRNEFVCTKWKSKKTTKNLICRKIIVWTLAGNRSSQIRFVLRRFFTDFCCC